MVAPRAIGQLLEAALLRAGVGASAEVGEGLDVRVGPPAQGVVGRQLADRDRGQAVEVRVTRQRRGGPGLRR